MKKHLSALMAVFLCLNIFSFSAMAAEENTIEIEQTIITTNQYGEAEFEETITQDGVTYELVEVTSTVQSVSNTEVTSLSEIVYYNRLHTQTVPESFPYMNGGNEYTLTLQDVQYERTLITGREQVVSGNIDFGNCTVAPVPDNNFQTTIFDEASGQYVNCTLPLIRLDQNTTNAWSEATPIPLTVFIYEAEYYAIGAIEVPYNNAAPNYIGFETDLLTLAGYNTTQYRIVGSAWTGATYIDTNTGEECRDGELRIERFAATYTAVYEATVGLPSINGYNATAYYSAELELPTEMSEYTILSVATYRPVVETNTRFFDIIPVQVFILAIILLIVLIVIILYVISKKRKDKETA